MTSPAHDVAGTAHAEARPHRAQARRAVANDLGALVHLYGEAMGELLPLRGGAMLAGLHGRRLPLEASFEGDIEATGGAGLVVVGTLDGQVVGYGSCRPREVRVAAGAVDQVGVIEELYVSPAARRCGVGRSMADLLVAWCERHDLAGVDAMALPGSRAVKSFFEAERLTARVLVMHRSLRPLR